MGKFANIYNEERTKEQYVNDKIQMLDDFLIFSKNRFLIKGLLRIENLGLKEY